MDPISATSTRVVDIFPGKKLENQRPFHAKLPGFLAADTNDRTFRPAETSAEHFHTVGAGAQGDAVVAAVLKKAGQPDRKVVAKRYAINQNTTADQLRLLRREIRNMKFLVHQNVVPLLATFWEPGTNSEGKGTIDTVWLVAERMDVSLAKYIELLGGKGGLRPSDHTVCLLVQLLMALDYLRQRGIMHRDINPKNIGLNKHNFVIKLLDFGSCGYTSSNGRHTTHVTTPWANRPLEVLLHDEGGYNCAVDIWAVALTVLEFTGVPLFEFTADDNRTEVEKRSSLMVNKILDVMGLNEYCHGFKQLIAYEKRSGNLGKRLTTAANRIAPCPQGISTPKKFVELLTAMLQPNPMDRPLPIQCLNYPYIEARAKWYMRDENRGRAEKSTAHDELLEDLRHFSLQI
ncbi:unnamed protein product, partial [Mesorhabditis spiculigera]